MSWHYGNGQKCILLKWNQHLLGHPVTKLALVFHVPCLLRIQNRRREFGRSVIVTSEGSIVSG